MVDEVSLTYGRDSPPLLGFQTGMVRTVPGVLLRGLRGMHKKSLGLKRKPLLESPSQA